MIGQLIEAQQAPQAIDPGQSARPALRKARASADQIVRAGVAGLLQQLADKGVKVRQLGALQAAGLGHPAFGLPEQAQRVKVRLGPGIKAVGKGLLTLISPVRSLLAKRQSRRVSPPRPGVWARHATPSGAWPAGFPSGWSPKGRSRRCQSSLGHRPSCGWRLALGLLDLQRIRRNQG